MIAVILVITATFICSVLFVINKQITFLEFVGMVLCLIFAGFCVYGCADIEFNNSSYFISGKLIKTIYYPEFRERYTEPYISCSGSGESRTCTTHIRTVTRMHRAYWTVIDNFNREWEVSRTFHEQVKKKFGSPKGEMSRERRGHCGSTILSGDPRFYVHSNRTNTYEYPVSLERYWHNPLIGSRSLFNMKAKSKVSLKYPKTDNKFWNTRYTKHDSDLTSHDWDVINTKLYEVSKANAILLHVDRFEECNDIKAAWSNGGLNDIIVCISGSYKAPSNVLVFGWSSNYLGLDRVEEFVLNRGLTKETSEDFLNLLKLAYIPTDFSKFNYLHKEHSFWFYIFLIFILGVVGRFVFICITTNDNRKGE